jgi:hypothetical protein
MEWQRYREREEIVPDKKRWWGNPGQWKRFDEVIVSIHTKHKNKHSLRLEMWFIFTLKNSIVSAGTNYLVQWGNNIKQMHICKWRGHSLGLHISNRSGHEPHISRHVIIANWAKYISEYAHAKFGLGDVDGVTKGLTQASHFSSSPTYFNNDNIVLLGRAKFPPYHSVPWVGTGQ